MFVHMSPPSVFRMLSLLVWNADVQLRVLGRYLRREMQLYVNHEVISRSALFNRCSGAFASVDMSAAMLFVETGILSYNCRVTLLCNTSIPGDCRYVAATALSEWRFPHSRGRFGPRNVFCAHRVFGGGEKRSRSPTGIARVRCVCAAFVEVLFAQKYSSADPATLYFRPIDPAALSERLPFCTSKRARPLFAP